MSIPVEPGREYQFTAVIRMPDSPRSGRSREIRGERKRKIEAQLRAHLAPWRLPLGDYSCRIWRNYRPDGPYYDDGPVRWDEDIPKSATFTHRRTRAEIEITQIWLGDDDEILQIGSQYGSLTL